MSPLSPLKTLLGPRCSDDPEQLRRYEIPERGPPGRAAGLLLPQSEEEVGAILRACNGAGIKVVISAGRTGLVEAQRPEGEAVLSLERLNRILDIDAAARLATVEAGVAVDVLNQALEPHGLFFPMEMGSTSAATVGACVANASAGANAVCYGTAAQMCDAAWGWWGTGEAAGACHAPPWSPPAPDQLAINSARVVPDWGLIGAQGVLGVITRVRLRLTPLPAQREGLLLPVEGMPAAMEVLAAARAEFPHAVEEFEFISCSAMNLVREMKGAAFRSPLGDLDAPFYVLLQVKSPDADEDLAGRLYTFVSKKLRQPDERIGYAPLKNLKAIRHSISEASTQRMKKLGGSRLAFDTATPVARFGDYLAALERQITAAHPGVEFVAFGHAGVGGAHLHLLGAAQRPVSGISSPLVKQVFDITTHFGGSFSAEHGVGTKWGDEFARRAPRAAVEELLTAKRLRDPRNVLNPRSFGLDRLL